MRSGSTTIATTCATNGLDTAGRGAAAADESARVRRDNDKYNKATPKTETATAEVDLGTHRQTHEPRSHTDSNQRSLKSKLSIFSMATTNSGKEDDASGRPRRSKSERFKNIFNHGPLRHLSEQSNNSSSSNESLKMPSAPSSPKLAPSKPRDIPGRQPPSGVDDDDSGCSSSATDEAGSVNTVSNGTLYRDGGGDRIKTDDNLTDLNPVVSSSAPPSRTASQMFSGNTSRHYHHDHRRRETLDSELSPPQSGGSSRNIFSHSNNKSKSAQSASSSSVSQLFSREKSIHYSPGQFLPKYLQASDYSLNAKYSIHKNLIKTRVIGKGATAVVRTVHHNKTKDVFAVKVYRKVPPDRDVTPEDYYQRLTEEYIIAKRLVHRNVVHTVELCTDSSDAWCQVMEYCDSGDLFSLIEAFKNEGKRMPKPDRNCLFKQLLSGTAHLHEKGIVHRDIKPENLLINSSGYLKISDFGVSEIIFNPDENPDEVRLVKGLSGSTNYIAPESFICKENNEKYDARPVDVWACAIVYINMAFNGLLFSEAKDSDPNYARIQKDILRYWNTEEGVDTTSKNNNGSPNMSEQPSPIGSLPVSREGSMFLGKPAIIQLDTEGSSSHDEDDGDDEDDDSEKDETPVVNNNGEQEEKQAPLMKPLFLFSEFGEAGKKVIAKMLAHDPSKRPKVSELLQTAFVRHIGLCLPPEDCEIDATKISSFKDKTVIRNHSHKPPPKAVKTIGMGHM